MGVGGDGLPAPDRCPDREALRVSWNTANDAVLDEGRRVLINDERRFDGVSAIGVDEHVWRHTRRGVKYVTVIIDLSAVRDGYWAGPVNTNGSTSLSDGIAHTPLYRSISRPRSVSGSGSS